MKHKKKKNPSKALARAVLMDIKGTSATSETEDIAAAFLVGDGINSTKKHEDSIFETLAAEMNVKFDPNAEEEDQNEDQETIALESPKVRTAEESAKLDLTEIPLDIADERTLIAGLDSDKTTPISSAAEPAAAPRPARPRIVPEAGKVIPVMSSVPAQGRSQSSGSNYDAQFLQAENLKIAQDKIFELEKDMERLRKEHESLSSANLISQQKLDEYLQRIQKLDRQVVDQKKEQVAELEVYKDALAAKESESLKLRRRIEDLENRLAADLKRIRVRERELENRLEISKMEKTTLLRSKDEVILDLKRKIHHLESEIESSQRRIIDLNLKLDSNQEQFGRTVRALRLALTNLEVSESTGTGSITIAPLKKAE